MALIDSYSLMVIRLFQFVYTHTDIYIYTKLYTHLCIYSRVILGPLILYFYFNKVELKNKQ